MTLKKHSKKPKTAPAHFDFEQAKRAKNRNLRMSPKKINEK